MLCNYTDKHFPLEWICCDFLSVHYTLKQQQQSHNSFCVCAHQPCCLHFKPSHTTKRRTCLVSASTQQPSLAVCLFIPFISLYPAVCYFPQPNRWLHEGGPGSALAHVLSKLPTLWCLYCRLGKVTEDKSCDVLTVHLECVCVCVCVCVCADKALDIWEKTCALCALCSVYVCGSRYSYTKFTFLSWESVRSCSCAALCVLYSVCDSGQRQK